AGRGAHPSRIDELSQKLRADGRKALMPFITAAAPDLEFTAALLKEIVGRGAALCEVGIPYSDPIADGPVIQASYTRALDKKIKVHQIFETLRSLKNEVTMPRVTMVSYAIIHRYGAERYIAEAQAAGVSGAIVPDLL